jgi:hypothetical protein
MSNHRPDRCRICGCRSLSTDEVVHRSRWLLAECERCHHRWMAELPDRPRAVRAQRAPSVRRGEVVRAA